MRILSQIKVTAGGRHAWYEASSFGKSFTIRKPLGVITSFSLPERKEPEYKATPARRSLWQRFLDWILGR